MTDEQAVPDKCSKRLSVPRNAQVIEVFTPYIRRRDGRVIYPKHAKVFHFFIVKP